MREGVVAVGVLILAVLAWFGLHAWLIQGPDHPDPRPLQVTRSSPHPDQPVAPRRSTVDQQAAPYS